MRAPRVRFTTGNLILAVVAAGLIFGFDRWLDRSAAAPEYRVVLCEGLVFAAVAAMAWISRRSRLQFLAGVLLGMSFVAFAHGVYFGVIANRHPGQHAGSLAGFGVTLALYLGLPLGTILGAVLILSRRLFRWPAEAG